MSIGWILSKVEGGLDWPLPLKASCNYFFFEDSRVKTVLHHFEYMKYIQQFT